MMEQRLQAVLSREQAWIRDYAAFRRWIAEEYVYQLLHQLPDPCPVGDVMVRCSEIMLTQLADLDRCEMNSRWPR